MSRGSLPDSSRVRTEELDRAERVSEETKMFHRKFCEDIVQSFLLFDLLPAEGFGNRRPVRLAESLVVGPDEALEGGGGQSIEDRKEDESPLGGGDNEHCLGRWSKGDDVVNETGEGHGGRGWGGKVTGSEGRLDKGVQEIGFCGWSCLWK